MPDVFAVHSLEAVKNFIYRCVQTIFSGGKIYLFWITVHYLASHLYPHFCAELSVYGFITSAIYVMTPHCRALAWLKVTSTMAIENMWIVLGAWFCAKLMPYVGSSRSTSRSTSRPNPKSENRGNSEIDEDKDE